MTYKELGSTFRQVAEGGAEAFYRGPDRARRSLGRCGRPAAGSARVISPRSLQSGASPRRSRIATARCSRCRRRSPRSRCSRRSTSSRATTCAGLRHNSVDYLHHLIEAVKLGSADRLAYAYGDGVADRRAAVQEVRGVPARRASTASARRSARASATIAQQARRTDRGGPSREASRTSRPRTSRAPMAEARWCP